MGALPASATTTTAPVAGRAGYLVCLGYDAWAPEKVVESLAGLGYRWCEWSTGHYAPGDPASLRRLKGITEAGGLGISELIAQQDYVTVSPAVWEERVARTETAIRDAAAAGIGTVNVLSGPNLWEEGARRVPAEVPTATAWELVWRAFDRIVPLAEREGIGLAFEACWGTLCDDTSRPPTCSPATTRRRSASTWTPATTSSGASRSTGSSSAGATGSGTST